MSNPNRWSAIVPEDQRDELDRDLNGSKKSSYDSLASAAAQQEAQQRDFEQQTTHTPASDEPPDGGYGWVCVAACFMINAHTWGLNSAYAVFLAHYLSTDTFPGATHLQYALIGGLSISMALLVAPLATTVTRVYGNKPTLLIGVVLEGGSFIAASFVKDIWQLFLSQGICFGFGMGFLLMGSISIISQWFTTRRSLANGIGAAGSGLGGLIYALAANRMIQTIGLPWAFRILGIVAIVVNTIASLFLKDRNQQTGSKNLTFDYTLFKRYEFLILQMFGVFSMLGYVTLLFSLPSYGASIGLTPAQGSVIGAIFQLGQMIGRGPVGYFSDSFGRINMAGAMSFLSGLFCLVVWVFADTYGVLIFYALIAGTVAGTYWAVIGPLAAEVIGLAQLGSGLTITWLCLVPPTTFSEAIALQIVEFNHGNYLGTQMFAGFMYIGAAVCMFFLRAWKIGDNQRVISEKDRVAIDKTSYIRRLATWKRV